jgi:hypothetical protein
MLVASSATVKAYCGRHDCDYEAYIGVKRGYKPWHATWNRVYMFRELVARGAHDWVVYMDADAYVVDLSFDLKAYLADKCDVALIATRSGMGEAWWEVNAGVVLLNLRHPVAHRLIEHWATAYEQAHPDEALAASTGWSKPDDQDLLISYLRENEDEVRPHARIEGPDLFNSPRATFIRQVLRDYVPNLATRTAVVRKAAQAVVGEPPAARGQRSPDRARAGRRDPDEDADINDFVRTCYLTLLNRHADQGGLDWYRKIVEQLGYAAGTPKVIRDLMRSDEFVRRMRPFPDDGLTLTQLADQFQSDKGSAHPEPHRYTLLYDTLLYPRRSSLTRMLEIGLGPNGPEVGGEVDRSVQQAPSVSMWLQYFPFASILGFDISDFSSIKHPRFQFIRGDSGVEADLRRAAEGEALLDLVVDDGSHASFHQQLALKVLFPKLAPGGLYIIESLHWQSPHYEGRLPGTMKTADLIEHWYREGRFPEMAPAELQGLAEVSEMIAFAFTLDQPFSPGGVPKLAVLQKKF